ncbi:MAG: hypothetical protein M1140_06630 [Chloroflexi bacterium]|nr:hypothetical protein [Chloroflexota bacterium]
MLQAIRIHTTVESDGEIRLSGLPFKKGAEVELIVLNEQPGTPARAVLTADQLLHSGLVGLWEDRTDIPDSSAYARQLRELAQSRNMN